MPPYSPPPLLEPSLRALQDYMHGFYPDRAQSDPIPINFWSVADDELFLEILSYMPLHISEEAQGRSTEWPVAFQLAFPIFWLEDDYEFNGWTALTNAGESLLQRAVDAYERIGMRSEAQALARALTSIRQAPDDEAAAERAYKSVPNPYADDEAKFEELLRFFRGNPQLWLTVDPP
jgi:hypothetical protein